jgi:hypothetical protein
MPGQFDVTASYWRFEPVVLAAGQTTALSFSWVHFNEARFVDFDATPDNVQAPGGGVFSLDVVARTARRPVGGGVTYTVVFRNSGSLPLVFRPRLAMIPATRFFGGLDR